MFFLYLEIYCYIIHSLYNSFFIFPSLSDLISKKNYFSFMYKNINKECTNFYRARGENYCIISLYNLIYTHTHSHTHTHTHNCYKLYFRGLLNNNE